MPSPTTPTLEASVAQFLRSMEGKNRSRATLVSYGCDLKQFVCWLQETNATIETPADVERVDVSEYLTHLARLGLSGVTRARKLAALREYFRFLEAAQIVAASPVVGIDTPKREQRGRNYLTAEEYAKLLSAAGGHPRDFAILQVFLQTGIRVSELCALTLDDIDLTGRLLRVRVGKGMVAREIELERKGVLALKSWLAVRPATVDPHLFLNRDGEPLGERGVQKLLAKYCREAGITKRISPHSLRHTFASYKAEQGVSPFQLQRWLGHANLNTTQIYVHGVRKNAKKVMEATSL